MKYMFTRQPRLPASGTETFFLWGPRQTGKTTLLEGTYPDAMWLDLLKADEYRRYLQNPELLRGQLALRPAVRQVVCLEGQSRRTDDGILVLSAMDFHKRLSAGDLF
jgi:uncharacterized protein